MADSAWAAWVTESLTYLLRRRRGFIWAEVLEVDWAGAAETNVDALAPAVKCQLKWMGLRGSTWFRVAVGFAGSGYGEKLPPEVGNVALVGFWGDGTEQTPVAVGFAHSPGKNPVQDWAEGVRGWRFPDGLELRADSRDGRSAWYLTTPGGHEALLSDGADGDGNRIRLKTPEGLTVDLDEEEETLTVEHSSGTKIVMNADGSMLIHVEGLLNTEATGDITIASDGNVTVSGLIVNITGSTAINLQVAGAILSGIFTQLLHPVCFKSGQPFLVSSTVKAT